MTISAIIVIINAEMAFSRAAIIIIIIANITDDEAFMALCWPRLKHRHGNRWQKRAQSLLNYSVKPFWPNGAWMLRCGKSQAETDESRRRSGTQMETGAETDEIKYLKKEEKEERNQRLVALQVHWCRRPCWRAQRWIVWDNDSDSPT